MKFSFALFIRTNILVFTNTQIIQRVSRRSKDIQCMISVERLVTTEPLERLYRFPTGDLLARVQQY